MQSYQDAAVGEMTKNEDGKLFVSQVTLRPNIQFSGEQVPQPAEIVAMHEKAHSECFLANSVKTKVVVDDG